MQAQREPKYIRVDREADLEKLIPGDRVRVIEAGRSQIMIYHNLDHDGKKSLNSGSYISFIEIPDRYDKKDPPRFFLEKGHRVTTLQFDENAIYLNHLYIDHNAIMKEDKKYNDVKSLVDRLQ